MKIKGSTATPLKANERLVLVGTVHADRKAAETRFAEAMAGRSHPRGDGKPLYAKEVVSEHGNLSGLTAGERKMCDAIISDFIALFAMHKEHDKGATT